MELTVNHAGDCGVGQPGRTYLLVDGNTSLMLNAGVKYGTRPGGGLMRYTADTNVKFAVLLIGRFSKRNVRRRSFLLIYTRYSCPASVRKS